MVTSPDGRALVTIPGTFRASQATIAISAPLSGKRAGVQARRAETCRPRNTAAAPNTAAARNPAARATRRALISARSRSPRCGQPCADPSQPRDFATPSFRDSAPPHPT
jgi:hypothetical protein